MSKEEREAIAYALKLLAEITLNHKRARWLRRLADKAVLRG